MSSKPWLATASAVCTILFAICANLSARVLSNQFDELSVLDGEWIFVEDRTEGRPLEQLGPPMSSKFEMKVEKEFIVLNGHGSGHKDVRIALDGSITEVKEPKTISRYSGSWKDGVFEYQVNFERLEGSAESSIKQIRRRFQSTKDGLMVSVFVEPQIVKDSVAIYRHAHEIAMPQPAKATIVDMEWLAGNWIGKKSTGSSIEERWSPANGGSMLAVSRSINASGKMFAFEYLRIVEREGGLVYVAQPGGKTPTEFILTEVSKTRAVFDNPRHDYPKRIVYEVTPEGILNTSIGQLKGGSPRKIELNRE